MNKLAQRQKKTVKVPWVYCPSCGRGHQPDPLYGAFCCLSCVQLVIRPLIVARAGDPRLR